MRVDTNKVREILDNIEHYEMIIDYAAEEGRELNPLVKKSYEENIKEYNQELFDLVVGANGAKVLRLDQ